MPSRSPSQGPSISPTKGPTKPTSPNSTTVKDVELVLNFGSGRRQLTTSNRLLQACLTQADIDLLETQLQSQADAVYADSDLDLISNSITITNIKEESDCSKITILYDQEIVYAAEDDIPTSSISEIIQLPLESDKNRQTFVDNLVENASVGSILKTDEGYTTEKSEVTESLQCTCEQTATFTDGPTSSPSIGPTSSPTKAKVSGIYLAEYPHFLSSFYHHVLLLLCTDWQGLLERGIGIKHLFSLPLEAQSLKRYTG